MSGTTQIERELRSRSEPPKAATCSSSDSVCPKAHAAGASEARDLLALRYQRKRILHERVCFKQARQRTMYA